MTASINRMGTGKCASSIVRKKVNNLGPFRSTFFFGFIDIFYQLLIFMAVLVNDAGMHNLCCHP